MFVDDTPGFRKVWMICQDKWQNIFVCCRLGLVRQKILSFHVPDLLYGLVRHMERQNLLSYKPKPTANKAVLPFVLTYHPDLPKARGIVDKHWSIIDSSDHLSTVFPQKPIMAYRRPKSLKDHLVRARLKPDPTD